MGDPREKLCVLMHVREEREDEEEKEMRDKVYIRDRGETHKKVSHSILGVGGMCPEIYLPKHWLPLIIQVAKKVGHFSL